MTISQATSRPLIGLFTVLISFFLLAPSAWGQNGFLPGKIVNTAGDTSNVFIRKGGGKINPYFIDYKNVNNEEILKGTPENIKMFQIDGDAKHIGATVEVDRSSDAQVQLTTTPEPNWEKRSVFLIELLGSKVSLYIYKSNNLTRFYYNSFDSNEFKPLIYKKYNVNQRIQHNRTYRKQLQENFSCGTDYDKLKDVDYTTRDLVKFFEAYNGCMGNEVQKRVVAKTTGSTIWTPTIGINLISGKMERVFLNIFNDPVETYNTEFESTQGIRIGLAGEKPLPRSKGKSSLIFEGVYEQIKSSGQWDDVLYFENGSSQRANQRVAFDVNHINFNFGLKRYLIRNENLKLFFSGSWSPSLNINLESSFDINSVNGNLVFGQSPNIRESSNFIFSLGLKSKVIAFEIKYNTNRDLTKDTEAYSTMYRAIGLTLNFQIPTKE